MNIELLGEMFEGPYEVLGDRLTASPALYTFLEKRQDDVYEIIYIGIASNLKARIRQHAKHNDSGPLANSTAEVVCFIRPFLIEDREIFSKIEEKLIKYYLPRENRMLFRGSYFDLNTFSGPAKIRIPEDNHPTTKDHQTKLKVEADTILEHTKEVPPPYKKLLGPIEQFILWTGTFAGVVFSDAFAAFNAGNSFQLPSTMNHIVISSIVAFAAFPGIYKSLGGSKDHGLFIAWCLFLQNGIAWRAIVETVTY